jgi:hypothetical protein
VLLLVPVLLDDDEDDGTDSDSNGQHRYYKPGGHPATPSLLILCVYCVVRNLR